jgi:hypothetical protein
MARFKEELGIPMEEDRFCPLLDTADKEVVLVRVAEELAGFTVIVLVSIVTAPSMANALPFKATPEVTVILT